MHPDLIKALGDWNPTSIGGQAIIRGWNAFYIGDKVESCWPYLFERGWYAAKASHEKETSHLRP